MTRLFGTNGIRGVVNQDMTGPLALHIGQAWGTYLKKTISRPRIVIGTDARLSNHMLKSAITAGLLSAGCDVVDIGLVPTPTVQYTVKEKQFDSGVIITASHNPPQFNGIKGIANDGIEFSKQVEEEIETIYFSEKYIMVDWKEVGNVSVWDGAVDLYLTGVLSTVDVSLIKKQHFHVVLDCGNGAGSQATPMLLKKLGCKVTELYCEPDGRFPGHNSEPIPENLGMLMKTVPQVGASFGFAQDGDADRAIFVDENGAYIWGDTSLTLAGKHLVKKKKGSLVVTPVTTSSCFEDVIQKHGGHVLYTKVGSPVVAREMKEKNAVFGGEENGGLIFPELQFCRDSAMSLVKVLEILAKEKKPLSELIADIPRYEMMKLKIPCPSEKKQSVMNQIIESVKDKTDIKRIDTTDGVKLYLNEGWVLVRPSGTEPLFRVFVETKEKTQTQHLAHTYKTLLDNLISEK